MELTSNQSAALGRYTQARQSLLGQMARFARLNRRMAAGDATEEIRREAGKARDQVRGLRPRAEALAKEVAGALPIFAPEIEAQIQEDREDLAALEAGEGAIIVGAQDAGIAADGMEEDYDVIPQEWWSVPVNRQLVEAGYSPFEIDADLRMRRMLKASGMAPELFQGYGLVGFGGEADWKRHKITMDVPGAATVKVWQTNHGTTEFIKTVTDPTGGSFQTRKKTGSVGFKRRADNPAQIRAEVTWKADVGGGKDSYAKSFSGNATWTINTKASATASAEKKSYKIQLDAGSGVAAIRVFQANNGPRVLLKAIPLGTGSVQTLKSMHGKRADNPAKLVVETVRKNPQGVLVQGTRENTFSADGSWSWTAPWLGGEDTEKVTEDTADAVAETTGGRVKATGGRVKATGGRVKATGGNRTQARARRTSAGRGLRRQTSRLAKLLARREFLKAQFKRLKKGPQGKYLDPLRAVTLKKQLRAVNRQIAKLRGERGMKKATAVLGEIKSKPKAKRIGSIVDALIPAVGSTRGRPSRAYTVIFTALQASFGAHPDLPEIAAALTRVYSGQRPVTLPEMSRADNRPSRENLLTALDRAMRNPPLVSEIPQARVREIAHAVVVALANAGLVVGGAPEPVTAGGLQPAQIEQVAEQAADIKEPVLAAVEQLATTTSELQSAAAQLEEKVAAADVAIAVAEAAPTASAAASAAAVEAQAESAEVVRLRALVEALAAQVQAQTASTAAQMETADAQLIELAQAMGTALGEHDAALAALDAMRHEGEVADVAEGDFSAAVTEPEPIVEGGFELLAEGDPFASDAFSGIGEGLNFSGVGNKGDVFAGYGAMDYTGGYGFMGWPGKSQSAGGGGASSGGGDTGKKSNVDANKTIGVVGTVVDTAIGVIGKAFDTFGPKKDQQVPQQQPIYVPAGGGEAPAGRSWLPWVIGGGAVAAAGVAAVLIAKGGGQGNMLMSRDIEGEFVPRWRAAPGFLDYDPDDAPSHLPSRDRSGRFVAGTRRAPAVGSRE